MNGEQEEQVKYVQGQCRFMCPSAEVSSRINSRLVHRLELDSAGKPKLLIKGFRRSAAGHNQAVASELRPPQVCVSTAKHLVEKILMVHPLDNSVYHFVFDRLRSLRQDLVVQGNCDPDAAIKILHISVQFFLLSGYLLGSTTSGLEHLALQGPPFDAHMNFTHLLDCLKDVLILHQNSGCDNQQGFPEMASAYLLLNLASPHAVNWGLRLPAHLRRNTLIRQSIKMTHLYLERDFVGFFKRFVRLPLLLMLAVHWNLPHIHSAALAVMNVAYSSKACRYPVDKFSKLFCMGDVEELCQLHNVHVYDGVGVDHRLKSIGFSKTNFTVEVKVPHKRISYIDDSLKATNLEDYFNSGADNEKKKSQ